MPTPGSLAGMKIQFTCPSCGAAGSLDSSFAGRPARCKQCRYRFSIPGPGETTTEVYSLEEPTKEGASEFAMSPDAGSTFVPRRGDEPSAVGSFRRPKPATTRSTTRSVRRHTTEIAWRAWLIRGMIAVALVSTAVALFAPRGTMIVGCLLMGLGSVLVLLGYGVGAYGAFREEVLYGMLYLLIPLYTAYYLATRWEDLWVWFACSTVGAALVVVGSAMVRSGLVGA
jgi:hypothetical protein